MLKTDFLGLNYHPNPATNTDAVDAEKYFNENYFTIDANAKSVNEQLNKQIRKVEQLQTENNELSSNMPWNTTSGKFLHITDSAKYSKNKLEISGDLEQENRSGKNLFDVRNATTQYKVDDNDWITISIDNTNNTNTYYVNVFTGINNNLKTNTTYYVVVEIKKVTGTGKLHPYSSSDFKDSQLIGSMERDYSDLKTIEIYKVTTKNDFSKSDCMIRTYCEYNGGQSGSITFRLSVLEDTSVTTDNFKYEKYGAMPSTKFPSMPLVCTGAQKIRQFGENWFNKNNISKINAVFGTSSIIANSSGKSFYIKIETGTYTVSRKVIGSRFVVGTTANIPKIGETIIERRVSSGSSITLTTSKNANYLVVYYLYNSSENEQEILDSIQIVRGSKATEYKSYIEEINTLDLKNTELCAIKDTNGNVVAKDRTVYRNGKWQWEKNIKKMVLNGTEAWKNATTGTVNHFRGQLYVAESKTRNALCDKFVCRTSEAHGEWNYVLLEKDSIYINIANVELSEATLNGFKTYLSSNNVTVYYALATPEYIDCTAEQSAVLDKLYNNFALQKGTNNIIVESENGVGVNMQLDYMQDLQTRLNILEAMCVSNASQEV